jgi:hypothetical protein
MGKVLLWQCLFLYVTDDLTCKWCNGEYHLFQSGVVQMSGRNFTRVNFLAGASMQYGNEMALCKTDNLSLRGMFLKTDQDIPLNVPVQVTVFHSNKSSLIVNALVVRKEASGVGLQITNLTVNSFAQLRDIVVDRSQDYVKALTETLGMLKCIQ